MNNGSLIISGAQGDLARAILPKISGDFCSVLSLDIAQNASIPTSSNISFEAVDLREGFSCNTLDYIERNAQEGICFLNMLGFIHSKSYVNIAAEVSMHRDRIGTQREELLKSFDLNFLTPIVLATEFANFIVSQRGRGCVISFSSVSSYGNIGQLGYSAMKSGLETASNVLAKEYGPFNVRFNCIAPGFMKTDSMESAVPDASLYRLRNEIPLRSFGDPASLIPLIRSLYSSDYINGQVIRVDGGIRL